MMPLNSSTSVTDISVIIPMYNAESFIEKTLLTILNQDPHPFRIEIIVVDDVSTDKSRERVLSMQNEKIRLIALPVNGGTANARNAGLQAATGKWIQFVDSDDTLSQNLYKQWASVINEQYNVWTFSLISDYRNYSLEQTITKITDKRAFGHFGGVWNLFIKRELCLPFTPISRQNEDVCFIIDMMIEKDLQIGLIPDAYYRYNRNNEHSKLANFHNDEYLDMFRYICQRIPDADKLTRMYILEIFFSLLFDPSMPLIFRTRVALTALLKLYWYLPTVAMHQNRHAVKNKYITHS